MDRARNFPPNILFLLRLWVSCWGLFVIVYTCSNVCSSLFFFELGKRSFSFTSVCPQLAYSWAALYFRGNFKALPPSSNLSDWLTYLLHLLPSKPQGGPPKVISSNNAWKVQKASSTSQPRKSSPLPVCVNSVTSLKSERVVTLPSPPKKKLSHPLRAGESFF